MRVHCAYHAMFIEASWPDDSVHGSPHNTSIHQYFYHSRSVELLMWSHNARIQFIWTIVGKKTAARKWPCGFV